MNRKKCLPPLTSCELRELLSRIPRLRLLPLPTPLEEAKRISRELDGPRIFIKRDDLTGIAFGGNKLRNLEFRLARASALHADLLILGVDVLSNSARQTVGLGNRLGMDTVLVLRGEPTQHPQGNLLLDYLLGARVHFVATHEAIEDEMNKVYNRGTREGRTPYILNADPMFYMSAVLAYALTFLEIQEQMDAIGLQPNYLYLSSGGKGQAGLVLAHKALDVPCTVRGITAIPTLGYDIPTWTGELLNQTAEYLGIKLRVTPDDIDNDTRYAGEGYGDPTRESLHALKLFARLEGIILDPVYTAKAAAGMMDHIKSGMIPRDSVLVFIHTGGGPNVFTYAQEILAEASGPILGGNVP